MLGLIFHELSRYVTAKLGAQAWPKLQSAALTSSKVYLATQSYPDAELVKLVTTAASMANLPVPAVLEDFGQFIAPSLLRMAGLMIDPKWKTLDLLENTEGTMHKMIRRANTSADPARLSAVRRGPKELALSYRSERKLCPVAKGVIKGVAAHYHERVSILETKCMTKGAPACEMTITIS